ncbi:MAG: transglycosylase domain-containing protein [Bacteroidetes bacterium]|nr:transglycosylase domain-containing protein [Bacteroidota bacterium]MBU1579102.1 transglycosylase domain-containing protein [Bacteroidota bacterium]MBU2558347.1 transglycosylase domain-containing protein [Bacteroidota bacterium]
MLFFYGITNEWFGKMPSFEELENPETNQASQIYSSDGYVLGSYYIENRSNVRFRDLSPDLVNALLAIEDIRFSQHSGIDERALLRVAWGVLTGNSKGGGSTLTQQLAKNLFPRGENLSTVQLVIRKFQEWVTATKLERNYSKEEIMAMYLNTVAFGSQSFGIKSASQTFFNKLPDSLLLEEAALMAGVVNAPTRYSPTRNPENALRRRNLVLYKMADYGFISQAVYDSVSDLPIDMSNYGILDHNSGQATYFREFLRGELHEWASKHFKADGSPYNIYKDGLRIYTTINSRMQQYAEEAVQEHLGKDLQPAFFKHWEGYTHAPFVFPENDVKEEVDKIMKQAVRRSERYRLLRQAGISPDSISKSFRTPVRMRLFSWDGSIDTVLTPLDSIRYYKYYLQASILSVDAHTGFVRAYVGGNDYRYFKYDHVTQARRQVGSTIKPLLYTLAMQEGDYSPCFKVPNIQYSVQLFDGSFWSPRNSSSDRIGEEVTLKWALANSNNWISAYLIKRFSPQALVQLARKMGVNSPIDPVPAIALGTPDLSLYEMVGAMNTYANQGVYIKPSFMTHIEDKNGNVIERFIPEKTEVLDEVSAYKMIELMKGVVESGTGIRLRFKYGFNNPIAGKTGTTQNQSDGWFMGITPDLTTGVWVGAEDRSVHFRTIKLGQGANMALPVWAIYMQKVYDDPTLGITKEDFNKPLGNVAIEFDCDKYDAEQALKRRNQQQQFEDDF